MRCLVFRARVTFVAIIVLGFVGCGGGNDGSEDDVHFIGMDTGNNTKSDAVTEKDVPQIGCQSAGDCPAELPYCEFNSSTCVACKQNEHCPAVTPYCNPARHECVECVMDNHCPVEKSNCLEGVCSQKACFPGKATCVGNTVHICSEDGLDPNAQILECGDGKCISGACVQCTPGAKECKLSLAIQCNADGSNYSVLEDCSMGGLDCFGGDCMVCYPGGKECDGNSSMQCRNDGTGWDFLENCEASGKTCYLGACVSPCAGDLKENTNAGCEFYAVDLDNAQEGEYDAQHAQFAVIASNTSESPATVTVTLPSGTPQTANIPANSLHKFELPATWSLDGTEKGMKSFKITSTAPITVYQFNPLDNEGVFSNDASVLLPAPNLGTDYYVMSYRQLETSYRGFFTVVAVSPGTTNVTVQPRVKTLAGTGVNSVPKGGTYSVALSQGEVLHMESDQANGDLTGSYIHADQKIAVFGGHEATNIDSNCCADHLEQQLVPVQAWGTEYLISKTWERWLEKDSVRIVASENFTKVTLNPSVAVVPELGPGEAFTFKTSSNVEITATKPIQVAQYLASSYDILGMQNTSLCSYDSDCPAPYTCDWMEGCIGPECTSASNCPSGHSCEMGVFGGYCAPIGDPAMMLAVSKEQFMDSYVFLVPDAYVEDYVNIIAPTNAIQVVLDGQQVAPTSFVPIGASGYGVYRTKLNDGIHNVWSDQKFGIMVYGYDDDVSYGYPGGMGLVDIN